jgi:uncharacterized protein involved in exopolysaccharide biosynthesis
VNQRQLPSVELIQGPTGNPASPPNHRKRRWRIFFGVLLIGLVLALAFVYGREPVYRASASVLTVKPKDVDRRSADADLEHVAIQGRLLMGEALLGRLAAGLAEDRPEDTIAVDRLRGMLAVTPVPDTNLLELRAEGATPERLQRIVNRWAETYESFRAEEIEAISGRTVAEIEDEQTGLRRRIEGAGAELQAFRDAHDIVSLERTENRSLSSLKGLNNSLNKARERLIEAQAHKAAIDAAIAAGETVIPDAEKAEIARLQRELQRARTQLASLRDRFTDVYIERDPATKDLPALVQAMQNELRIALQLASTTVSDEAQQAVEAARLSVEALERQLDEQQQQVQVFTERFKEFKRLEQALAGLEELYADNQTRLAGIQVQNFEKYPPIQVVEWARLPTRPIYPDYERDLLIALGGAVLLALFVTWLVEYLSASASPAGTAQALGVRIYPGQGEQRLSAASQPDLLTGTPEPAADEDATPLTTSTTPRPAGLPRELSAVEVQALLAASDQRLRSYGVLLLNGISPYELPLLHAACFDTGQQAARVPGAGERLLRFSEAHWRAIEPLIEELDTTPMPLTVAACNEQLAVTATQAKLDEPGTIDALALWHSYILFLVRQGIQEADLSARVGALPAPVLDALAPFAPAGDRRPISDIQVVYPAFPA